ncbi:hypothetical protein D3C72_1588570 [compost metagenome]
MIRLPDVEKLLVGQKLSADVFDKAGTLAGNQITPISDLRASQEYRRLVTKNLFKKCFVELTSNETVEEEALCP